VSKPFHLLLLDAQMPGMDGYDLAKKIRGERKETGPAIVLLTSAGRKEPQARRSGINASLLKPIKQSDLLDTILEALSGRSRARPTAPRTMGRVTNPLSVLVVEDNRVNQTMAQRILEKRGHRVTLAENGRQAVDAIAGGASFDVVLMDVQMPVMNGLEATAHIRAGEGADARRLPIVAMTAHAMRGDRARCLEAGMDGYLVKPIQADELIVALESFAQRMGEPRAETTRGEPAGSRSPIHTLSGGNVQRAILARELAGIFLDDWSKLASDVDQALEKRDAEALRLAAHTLKGAVANFGAGAGRAAAAALRLEKIGAGSSVEGAAAAWAEAKREIEAVVTALRSLTERRASARKRAAK
jgi:CheY-like chemotaxis protein/HPt (histidine-containing phosphotransfer) domain-containing protein